MKASQKIPSASHPIRNSQQPVSSVQPLPAAAFIVEKTEPRVVAAQLDGLKRGPQDAAHADDVRVQLPDAPPAGQRSVSRRIEQTGINIGSINIQECCWQDLFRGFTVDVREFAVAVRGGRAVLAELLYRGALEGVCGGAAAAVLRAAISIVVAPKSRGKANVNGEPLDQFSKSSEPAYWYRLSPLSGDISRMSLISQCSVSTINVTLIYRV